MKIQKMIYVYILPPSSANNDIRSRYSTPLPLQSISFITSWTVRVAPRRSWKFCTCQELLGNYVTGVSPPIKRFDSAFPVPFQWDMDWFPAVPNFLVLIPQNQTKGKEHGPLTVQNHSQMYMRIYERPYLRAYAGKQICRYACTDARVRAYMYT